MLTKRSSESDVLFVVVLMGMFVYMLYKIHLGLHYDEAYLIDLGKVKVDGTKGITECWDILQMAGYILYPFMYLFHLVVGSYDGVILFFRYIYLIIHFCIAIYAYYTINEIWGRKHARVTSCIAFMFSFYWYSVCYRAILFWGLFLTILFILHYIKSGRGVYLVLSAIGFCLALLCYPSLIIMVIPFLFFFMRCRDGKKEILIFGGTCIFIAFIVVVGLVAESGMEVFGAIKYSVFYDEKMDNFHKIRTCVEIFGILASGFAINNIYIQLELKLKRISNYYMLVFLIISAFLFAIIVARPMSAGVSRFWYTYILFFSLMYPDFLRNRGVKNHAILNYLFMIPSIWLIFVIALSTANGVAIAAYGSIFGLMGILLYLNGNELYVKNSRMLIKSILVMFLFCMVFFVPDNELGSSNIFWKRELITKGPGKGIAVTSSSLEKYDAIYNAVNNNICDIDNVFILGSGYRAYGFLCTEAKQVSSRAYYVSPDSTRCVDYFLNNKNMKPTKVLVENVLIESNYVSYSEWENESALGLFIKNNYTKLDNSDGNWTVYRIKNTSNN